MQTLTIRIPDEIKAEIDRLPKKGEFIRQAIYAKMADISKYVKLYQSLEISRTTMRVVNATNIMGSPLWKQATTYEQKAISICIIDVLQRQLDVTEDKKARVLIKKKIKEVKNHAKRLRERPTRH